MRLALVLVGLAVPAIAQADGAPLPDSNAAVPRDGETAGSASGADPASNRINLRVGNATSDSTGRPTICVDVRIVKGFGAETCGTGQGVIHDQAGSELAHFRGTFSFLSKRTSTGTAKLRGGLGFAELQVGVDHPGFHFGEPDSVERGSVAGPEAVVQAQYLVPLGKGIEAIASLTAGVAVFANADKLVAPQSNTQPFVSGEIGFGW